jgi:AcrR family transcriptional regulator
MRRDERRAQILGAAAAAFSREGFAATSMDEVATEAGITKLIVYRHFDSKEELYRAILEEVATRLGERWEHDSAANEPGGFAARTLLTVARELPDGFRLLFVHARREQEFAAYADDVRAIQLALADDLLGELLDPGPIHDWVVKMSIDYLVSAVLEWIDIGPNELDAMWERRVNLGLRAMVTAWVIGDDESWLPVVPGSVPGPTAAGA